MEKRFVLGEKHLNKIINDACPSANVEMNNFIECLNILTDVENVNTMMLSIIGRCKHSLM